MRKELSVIHVADIHWRGLTRHEEYRQAFQDLFKKASALNPDIIYVGGDIVHNKTQGISPELIDSLNWWFSSLAKICDVHVILGNHDGILHNKRRQDAISPILSALNNDRIHLYKKSGIYPTGIPGFNWAVFSCFDEEGWEDVAPIRGDINIALYHGAVRGSLTDINWEVEGEADISFFDDYEFALLGDIHKPQFLNEEKTVAYCGSTVQQNYGEDMEKGFMFWKIRTASDFDVSFHPLEPVHPFVTIEWQGNVAETLKLCRAFPVGSRFRIKASDPIPQVEVLQLQNELKDSHKANEVVFKYDDNFDTNVISTESVSLFKKDLRDPATHLSLFKEFLGDDYHTDKEWNKISDMLVEYIRAASREDDVARNVKWSINKIEFDNIFSFGAGNVVDFTKNSGITGIFAPNASGKSSIVGAIMYNLFNTTDRGSIKNLYVINGRKNFCKVCSHITVNTERFRIERQTVRNENRRGQQHGITHLNLYNIKDEDNIIDKTGEQRTMTEKTIRKMIGTADDFLLTSFASQGEMNRFIQEGATHRKRTLAKFLDLTIFEKLFEYAKNDSATIKLQLESAPDRDWDSILTEKRNERKRVNAKIKKLQDELIKNRASLFDLKTRLKSMDNNDIITQADVDRMNVLVANIDKLLLEKGNVLQDNKDTIVQMQVKLLKIRDVKKQFPIDTLREELEEQVLLRESIVKVKHSYEKEALTFNSRKKSIKILQDVPCGDSFPSCKFIKNSHENKSLVEKQEHVIGDMMEKLETLEANLGDFISRGIEEKISKYDVMLKKEGEYLNLISLNELECKSLEIEKEGLHVRSKKMHDDLAEIKSKVCDSNVDSEIVNLRSRIDSLNDQINTMDANRISLASLLGENKVYVEKIKKEKTLYAGLRSQWNTYQSFMKAVSKKGIPAQIIHSQLPIINTEISKILNGVVDFTVEFDATASNSMDIFIDYGDTRRIIELASGMEKMISSLAIRVALLNVSSLPKPDMLIIDEGFGVLDENKVTACNQLLVTLKKFFRNILVITHVDAIKDVADNILEINKNGMDSHVTTD